MEIPNFTLNKHFNYYTFSDENGRDVFYYHMDSEEFGFPYQVSVNLEFFENFDYLFKCLYKLSTLKVYDEHFERYLFYFFRRALTYKEFNLCLLDEVILDKNGKYCPAVNKMLMKKYKKVSEEIPSFISTYTAYSSEYSEIIFFLLKMQLTNKHISEKFTTIGRSDFEKGLINDPLKYAYLEEYDTNNNFYSELIDKEHEHYKLYNEVYVMTTLDVVKLIYLK